MGVEFDGWDVVDGVAIAARMAGDEAYVWSFLVAVCPVYIVTELIVWEMVN